MEAWTISSGNPFISVNALGLSRTPFSIWKSSRLTLPDIASGVSDSGDSAGVLETEAVIVTDSTDGQNANHLLPQPIESRRTGVRAHATSWGKATDLSDLQEINIQWFEYLHHDESILVVFR